MLGLPAVTSVESATWLEWRVECDVAAEAAWAALSHPEQLAQWFGHVEP